MTHGICIYGISIWWSLWANQNPHSPGCSCMRHNETRYLNMGSRVQTQINLSLKGLFNISKVALFKIYTHLSWNKTWKFKYGPCFSGDTIKCWNASQPIENSYKCKKFHSAIIFNDPDRNKANQSFFMRFWICTQVFSLYPIFKNKTPL